MMIIDSADLLRAIRPDAPCGEDLEYDAEYLELERKAKLVSEDRVVDASVAGEGPDWKAVGAQARALLSRTKDLRVVMLAIKAAVRLGGLPAFSTSVSGLLALLEEYWDSVHPRLMIDGDDNTIQRVNVLRELCDRQGVLVPLRAAPLVVLRGVGSFSLRDIATVVRELSSAQPEAKASDTLANIDTAFRNADPEELRATQATLRKIVQDMRAIESLVSERTGSLHGLDLEPLAELLGQMNSELVNRSGSRLAPEPAPVQASNDVADGSLARTGAEPLKGADAAALAMPAVSGAISTREDVIRALERVCEYYDAHEPSSPVPMLLRRAQRLVPMTFFDLVRDLAPAGMSDLETIRGPQPEN